MNHARAALPEELADEAEWLTTKLDERELRDRLPVLERSLRRVTWSRRQAWSSFLDGAWERLAANPPDWDVPFALGRVAARIGFWRQARDFFQASLRSYGEHAATWHNLAMSHWQLGALDAAEAALAKARDGATASAPIQTNAPVQTNASIQIASNDLAAYRRRAARRLGGDREFRAPENDLALMFMTPLHAEGLFHHQRGGSIAQPAGLPRFDSASSMRTWVEGELADDRKLPLTMIHPAYGPVGAAGLRITARCALFHYWIGEGLQGQGLGQQLVSLLLVAARSLGLRTLFGSVYRDNGRSRHVLAKRGFERLPRELTNRPHPQEVFCHRLDDASFEEAILSFEQLCGAEKLTFAVVDGQSALRETTSDVRHTT